MIPQSVDYKRASSVKDAIAILGANPDAKILSGGHSLIPALKLRLSNPSLLIDINKISELRYIKDKGNYIAIGANSTHKDIISNAHVARQTAMVEAGEMIGDVQIRNVGTIGGSIAHADPSADWPAVLMALGTTIKTEGPDGERETPAADFFTGFFSTALEEGEIVTEVKLPEPKTGQKSSYQKFMQPASRFAIVGCAASVVTSGGIVTEATVAFTGVSLDGAFIDDAIGAALVGKAPTTENIEAAANAAAENCEMNEDNFASAPYRKQMAKVFAKRALLASV